jgi:hypothetical protein
VWPPAARAVVHPIAWQFLGDANVLLGGGTTAFAIADLGSMLGDVNGSFGNGAVTNFALDHLVERAGTTPDPIPEPSTILLMLVPAAGAALRRWRFHARN